jgi:hypothetical protein
MQKFERKEVVGGASRKLLKIKVQICDGFCKQEERGGCKGSVRVKRAGRRGRISYRARWPFEIPLEGWGTQGKNSAEAITILHPKLSFVKANSKLFVCNGVQGGRNEGK